MNNFCLLYLFGRMYIIGRELEKIFFFAILAEVLLKATKNSIRGTMKNPIKVRFILISITNICVEK